MSTRNVWQHQQNKIGKKTFIDEGDSPKLCFLRSTQRNTWQFGDIWRARRHGRKNTHVETTCWKKTNFAQQRCWISMVVSFVWVLFTQHQCCTYLVRLMPFRDHYSVCVFSLSSPLEPFCLSVSTLCCLSVLFCSLFVSFCLLWSFCIHLWGRSISFS